MSIVQCVTRCRLADGCIAVAVDRSELSLTSCATLAQGDLPYTVSSCDDVTSSVVIYKSPDVDVVPNANNSCHCLYATGLHDNVYSQAELTCAHIDGRLPEADTAGRLQVITNDGSDFVWMSATRTSSSDDVFSWPRGSPVESVFWEAGEPNTGGHLCTMLKAGLLKDKHCTGGITSPYIKCVVFLPSCDLCSPSIVQPGTAQMAVLEAAYRFGDQ